MAAEPQRGPKGPKAKGAKGPKEQNGRTKKKKNTSKGGTDAPRKARRAAEVAEIKELEARIAAEAPAPGRAGSLESGDSGKAAGQAEKGGPSLTQQLFSDLPLSHRTKQGLKASKFIKMTEIQRGAIPRALAGRDLLGEARTGSGKTLAFLVPLVELLFRQRWSRMDGLGGLVVSPTRELAYQIFQVLAVVGTEHEISAGCIVGGRSLEEEQKAVAQMNVLVATPGRLLQHLDESPGFDASRLLMLVLDEADRILDFGFQETVHHILGHLPTERQTLLFSATLRTGVQRLSRAALRAPEVVSVHQDAKSRTPDQLKQVYMVVPLEQKVDTLFSFLRSHSQKKIIVFVSACKEVRFYYEAFRKLKPGPSVMELHGRQSLTKRLLVFQEFTERETAVALFCTDVAARGVDFPAVDWVVQMDCPDTVDSYIHRVGRTARYQSSGNSALFLLPSEQNFMSKLTAARVSVRSISAKQGKLVSIQGKLSGLLAGDGAVKHLAQKAFTSYVRSILLMKDKEVFDVKALPRDAFAQSLGLVEAPDLGDLGAEADLEKNPLKKQKNQTALQRLKERIKQKKEAKKAGTAGAAGAATARGASGAGAGAGATAGAGGAVGGGGESSDDNLEADLEAREGTKKLGRWERRQRRLERQRAAAQEGPAEGARPGDDEQDDLLQLVGASEGGEAARHEAEAAAAVAGAARRQKLKLRRDGQALNAQGKHTFFTGKEGQASSNGLAQLAEEMQSEGFNEGGGGRAAFLQRVSKDLAARDVSDAVVSRKRVHEIHQKRRRKEKEERRGGGLEGDDGDAFVAQLGSASGSSAEEDDGSASEAPEAPRSPSPPRQWPGAKRRRLGTAAGASGDGAASTASRGPASQAADPGEDPLAALERQALGKLGAGLFS